LWLLSIVLSATKFESPVCEGGLMGRRFKNRGAGSIEADERGGAEAGAAGEVDCFDVSGFCDGTGYRSADSNVGIRMPVGMSPSQNRLPAKRVSAGFLQHEKRVLELHSNVQKGQRLLIFVAVQDVAIQSFGKKTLKSMSASRSCSATAANVPVK